MSRLVLSLVLLAVVAGKLTFKHGSLVIFGSETLAPGTNTVDFKPKPGY